MNLQTGAFGNPADLKTLILFWTKMELLHYPGASDTKSYLEAQLVEQQAAQQMMAMQQMTATNMAGIPGSGGLTGDGVSGVENYSGGSAVPL